LFSHEHSTLAQASEVSGGFTLLETLLETFGGNQQLLLDEKMAVNPKHSKIDALLASIEIGSDEKVIKTRCHGLHLADFPLILTQLCLKPKPGATAVKVNSVDSVEAVIEAANDENVAVATTTTTTTTTVEGANDKAEDGGEVGDDNDGDDKDGDDNDGNRGATVVIPSEDLLFFSTRLPPRSLAVQQTDDRRLF
jgi:hypothetical protein